MTTLTEFLLARIAEDEEGATPSEGWSEVGVDHDVPVQFWDYGEVHIGHKRFLAECEAKRRIVEQAQDPGDDLFVRILATVYADHPDYDASWRP